MRRNPLSHWFLETTRRKSNYSNNINLASDQVVAGKHNLAELMGTIS